MQGSLFVAYNIRSLGGVRVLQDWLNEPSITEDDLVVIHPDLLKVLNTRASLVPISGFFGWIRVLYLCQKYRSHNIISIGSLPLPFIGSHSVFLQNRLLFDVETIAKFGIKVNLWSRIRSYIFFILVYLTKKSSEYIVQTPTMRRLFLKKFSFVSNVAIRHQPPPFAEPKGVIKGFNGFFYPASGEAHKNHIRLFIAWANLAKKGLFIPLFVTLDPQKDVLLINRAEALNRHCGTHIKNLGLLSEDMVINAMLSAGCVIYPSVLESYGLPLVDADKLGAPIIAGELDYVRDVCVPIETFDVNSATSIARAVKRFVDP